MLPLLQQGRSNAQIALALQVGVETVRTHARNIYRKLGVSSRRELAAPGPSATQAPSRTGSPRSPRRDHRGGGPPRGWRARGVDPACGIAEASAL